MHWSIVAGHRKRMLMMEYQVKSLQIKSAQYEICQCVREKRPKEGTPPPKKKEEFTWQLR